ncbi:MAG: pantoate--beta-alanine ligase [Bacteroidetes bacterium]|nr:pantoate--beta-alanine ligase [Bacteroidota bacterium]
MQYFRFAGECREYIKSLKYRGIKIGFVPTMGALHAGHISLVSQSKTDHLVTGCSLFVNPDQFNDKRDFEKYPRTEKEDVTMLEQSGCDFVFIPGADEIYPQGTPEKIPFDTIPFNNVMEGLSRPGHFRGVIRVVKRLFEIVEPDCAYFGEKDFQQLLVIKEMVNKLKLAVQITGCPTLREQDGIAMSSRNANLSPDERKAAPLIYRTLLDAKAKIPALSVLQLKKWVIGKISSDPKFRIDYFEIAGETTLEPVAGWDHAQPYRAFIATFLGTTRLIDNLRFSS